MSYAINNEFLKREDEELHQNIANLKHEIKIMREIMIQMQDKIKLLEFGDDWTSVRLNEKTNLSTSKD